MTRKENRDLVINEYFSKIEGDEVIISYPKLKNKKDERILADILFDTMARLERIEDIANIIKISNLQDIKQLVNLTLLSAIIVDEIKELQKNREFIYHNSLGYVKDKHGARNGFTPTGDCIVEGFHSDINCENKIDYKNN